MAHRVAPNLRTVVLQDPGCHHTLAVEEPESQNIIEAADVDALKECAFHYGACLEAKVAPPYIRTIIILLID